MMHAIRSSVRSVARVAAQRSIASSTLRSFTTQTFRAASVYNTPEDAKLNNHSPDLPLRVDEEGVKWADYRPENLRNIQAVRNSDGDLVGKFEGEEVIFPDLEPTLEWVLSTPVDLHLFEEAPIIKMYIEESHDKQKAH